VKYNDLAWGAVLYYYRSAGDTRYVAIMSDSRFIETLRSEPHAISGKEFEEKAILGYIKIENYDLLMKHKLAMTLLQEITELMPFVYQVQDLTILTADLSETGASSVSRAADHMYKSLCDIHGMWSTGASKILHLLNNRLFPMVTPEITDMLHLPHSGFSMSEYMKRIQYQAATVCEDFKRKPSNCNVADYLSEKLGYTEKGCTKSLVKFIDEYYYMVTSGLPVPPAWVPDRDAGLPDEMLARPASN
jgi:hypothetical protein